jgi:hypothetical protein
MGDFKLYIEGEDAEERAWELANLIEKELGQQPNWEQQKPPHVKEKVKAVEPISVAALILSIPSVLLAALDLVDRLKKKKKVDLLIQWAKDNPGEISIRTPEGTVIQLQNADSGKILDAAKKG